jgi:calcineurin-like phosphoesterase family protein
MIENVPAPPLQCAPPDFRSYFIELRIGTPEWRLNQAIVEARTRYFLEDPTGPQRPGRNLAPSSPHISLYGGFTIRPGFSFSDVKRVIGRTCRTIPFFPYRIGDYESRLGYSGGVVAFRVIPSVELAAFRSDLIEALHPITNDLYPQNNNPGDLWYHATLGYRLDPGTYTRMRAELVAIPAMRPGRFLGHVAERLVSCATGRSPVPPALQPVELPADALRLTVLHRNMVAAEYDLISGRWLSRRMAGASYGWGRTLSRYRKIKGYELCQGEYPKGTAVPFVIGDLHLGNPDSINRFSRPFPYGDSRTMDAVLISNWNRRIRPGDEVYCIGPISVHEGICRDQYISRLNGTIYHIPADPGDEPLKTGPILKRTWQGVPFLFVHNPAHAPDGFEGYIVHGHHHNTDLKKYPFFNPEKHRFNVCPELTGYHPLSLSHLCDYIRMRPRRVEFCE